MLKIVENEEVENICPSLNIGENTRGLSSMTGIPTLIIFIRQEKDPEAEELKHIRSTECGYTLAIKIRIAKANAKVQRGLSKSKKNRKKTR